LENSLEVAQKSDLLKRILRETAFWSIDDVLQKSNQAGEIRSTNVTMYFDQGYTYKSYAVQNLLQTA
jgi:hypothetical protein